MMNERLFNQHNLIDMRTEQGVHALVQTLMGLLDACPHSGLTYALSEGFLTR